MTRATPRDVRSGGRRPHRHREILAAARATRLFLRLARRGAARRRRRLRGTAAASVFSEVRDTATGAAGAPETTDFQLPVRRQTPYRASVCPRQRLHAPALPQVPQAHGAVGGARQAEAPRRVHRRAPHGAGVPFEQRGALARARGAPAAHDTLHVAGHQDGARASRPPPARTPSPSRPAKRATGASAFRSLPSFAALREASHRNTWSAPRPALRNALPPDASVGAARRVT